MAERGVQILHAMLASWEVIYPPDIAKFILQKDIIHSWRMGETHIMIEGR